MRDPRVTNLAKILVGYSTKVGEGDTCVIEGPSSAEPLVAAVYEEVLAAGGHPIVTMAFEEQPATYYGDASDEQLEWISPPAKWAAEESDCRIAIGGDTNTRQLSRVDPERQTKRQAATRELMELTMRRAAEGDAPLGLHAVPDQRLRLGCRDEPRASSRTSTSAPAWPTTATRSTPGSRRRTSATGSRTGSRATRRSTSPPRAPTSPSGSRAAPSSRATASTTCPTASSSPGPVEDSVEGEVSFHLPAVIGGREVTGVRFRFESGKIVDASAERGEEYLINLIDTDEGSRRLGELGIGTNYGIDRGTRDVLLDEKIGGTVHMAVGARYPESGGENESAVHTDLVCDLRRGGKIEVDGELFQENGEFKV